MPGPFECVIFDCDSTLTQVEGIDCLAGPRKEEIEALTRAAMGGQSSFHEVYGRRLDLLRPSFAAVNEVGRRYVEAVTPRAPEVVAALQSLQKRVFVFSGGFRLALSAFARFLGITGERVFGVDLYFDDGGRYGGFDEANRLTYNHGKTEVVKDLAGRGRRTVFVGDGVTDLEAGAAVDLFIGFGGVVRRPEVERKAAYYVKTASLAPILPIILTSFEQGKLLSEPRFAPVMKEGLEEAQKEGLKIHG